jgi:hypothetical protein
MNSVCYDKIVIKSAKVPPAATKIMRVMNYFSRRFKIGTGQLRETAPTENNRSSRIAGSGHGANNPTEERLNCSETKEAKAKLKGP